MVTPEEQEEFIDKELKAWKTHMMKTPNSLPVLMLTATDTGGDLPNLALFVVEQFRPIYMQLLQLAVRSSPVERPINEEGGPNGSGS